MAWLLIKYLIVAGIVVLVSEVARRSGRFGGFVGALPLMTILVLVMLHLEGQPREKVADFARYTFWYVLPTLPMFLAFPFLQSHLGFWWALLACLAITLACTLLIALALRPWGIELLP